MMRPTLEAVPMGVTVRIAGSRSRLAFELRAAAEDLAGRVDRDELTLDEELRLSDALDEVVDTVLPEIMQALDEVMTPRLEALPLHARLALARARDRRELGLE
jgi:hypothetical protein